MRRNLGRFFGTLFLAGIAALFISWCVDSLRRSSFSFTYTVGEDEYRVSHHFTGARATVKALGVGAMGLLWLTWAVAVWMPATRIMPALGLSFTAAFIACIFPPWEIPRNLGPTLLYSLWAAWVLTWLYAMHARSMPRKIAWTAYTVAFISSAVYWEKRGEDDLVLVHLAAAIFGVAIIAFVAVLRERFAPNKKAPGLSTGGMES